MDNKDGNGGAASPTPEELAFKKREAFNANPDEFIHIPELIIGTRLLPSGQVQCVILSLKRE